MKREDLKKILIDFAELLEQYGAENITKGIEAYAEEFARTHGDNFDCYEIWRPNIPDNGCKEQCKECKDKSDEINLEQKSKNSMLLNNSLGGWILENGWTFNFCDEKFWQLQESHNYIKKTTLELANMWQEELNRDK